MEARLVEMAVLGNRIRDGHTLGVAEGPLLVDPVSAGAVDSITTLRGRVPGGGVSLTSRVDRFGDSSGTSVCRSVETYWRLY